MQKQNKTGNIMDELKDFKGFYPLLKTLRFELKPVELNEKDTTVLDNIKKSGIFKVEEDTYSLQERQKSDVIKSESYKKVKKIIDDYHRQFISKSLATFSLDEDYLKKYVSLFKNNSKSEKENKEFGTIKSKLREQISNTFDTTHLFNKEFFNKELIQFVNNDKAKEDLIKEFEGFTTYFTGFNDNRKNMYSAEDKASSIAHRIINDNLPKFLNNISSYDTINEIIQKDIQQIEENFKEELNGKKLDDVFKIENYSNCLTQKDITTYNTLIGGKSEGDKKIKGLKEYVNSYNQKNGTKLPKFIALYKQILSSKDSLSWLPEIFEDDAQCIGAIKKVYNDINEKVINTPKDKISIKSLLSNLTDYSSTGIFVQNEAKKELLTSILQSYYGDWAILTKALEIEYLEAHPRKGQKIETYNKNRDTYVKSFKSFSLQRINDLIGEDKPKIEDYFKSCGYKEETISCNKEKDLEKQEQEIIDTFKDDRNIILCTSDIKQEGDNLIVKTPNIFEQIERKYLLVKDILNADYQHSNKALIQDTQSIEKIKLFLDSIKKLQWFIKPLSGCEEEAKRDNNFYSDFDDIWEDLNEITPLYNSVRNYLTQKPYSEEKIKLNFQDSTLLGGWDVNKEPKNLGILLIKDGLYYLAIINKDTKKVFENKHFDSTKKCYQKIDYKQIADAGKDIQNIIRIGDDKYQRFTKNLDALKKKYIPEIYAIKQAESYLQDKSMSTIKTFSSDDLKTFITYYKEAAKQYWTWCNFSFSDEYQNWKSFTDDVNMQGYKITFRDIEEDYINQLVKEGKIYLFQIYNKDFSLYSKGTPNMHTLYWKALFDENNLKDVIYKLNGQAEVFFRKKSFTWNDEVMKNGHHAKELKGKFTYPIIKDKRYTEDKFLFHVPITMNFKAVGTNNINSKVNEFIKDNGIKHIIGIDRGERNLLYLTLIDLQGNIVRQFSLNTITNVYMNKDGKEEEKSFNYHNKLDNIEKDRQEARKNWQTIENIKELKEGYLSQVIHKITQMMIEYKAIVVLEDLNSIFMRGRQKVEKSVYQKFEKMLIDKLNYLVDKKKDPNEEGGLLNAYQLTNKFESFEKMSKQNGFLFYIPAWKTSKIDPVTGFTNYIYTKYENEEKAKELLSKFADILYNEEEKYFEFVISDYTKFNPKADETRKEWTICTYGKRIKTFRNKAKNNQWDNETINLTEALKTLFNSANIDYKTNLKDSILNQGEKAFFEELLNLLKLTLQMRNSNPNTDEDYILSPVADSNGVFFDSREHKGETASLPQDADANGAYNIARKGLWAVRQIQNADDGSKVSLAMSNKKWLNFVQNKEYLDDKDK